MLFAGFGYGALFALVIFCMSSGIFGSSATLDQKASQTFLDTGDECENIEDTPWIHIFPENDLEYFSLAGHNLEEGFALMNYSITDIGNEDWAGISNEIVEDVKGATDIRFIRSPSGGTGDAKFARSWLCS